MTGTNAGPSRSTDERFPGNEGWSRHFVRFISDIITFLDADGTIRYESPSIERVLGYRPEELVGKNVFGYVHPDDLERVLEVFAEGLAENGATRRVEFRFRHADGSWRHLEGIGSNLLDEPSMGRTVVSRDISRLKDAEQALRESEANLAEAQRVAHLGSWDIGPLKSEMPWIKHKMRWSDELYRIFGFAPREFLPTFESLIEAIHPLDRERVARSIRDSMSREETYLSLKHRILRPDGEVRFVQAQIETVYDEDGEPLRKFGTVLDTTEQRRTERALEESEQRFRQLFEQSVDALFVHDEEGRFVDCNVQACLLLGYSREELLSMSLQDISCNVLTEEESASKEDEGGTRWQRALAAGAPGTFAVSHEEEYRRKDGTTFPVEVRVGSVDYGGRRMILASIRDITERKRAAEALRESEGRHRRQAQELALLYRVSTALTQELNLPTIFRTVVEAVAETFGYTQVSAYQIKGEDLVLEHQVGYDRVIERMPITRGVSGRVVRSGQPMLLEDVREDPDFLGAVEGITSEVCVPLFAQDRVVGVLNVESVGGIKLTQADLRLTSALGEQVSTAIERAWLYTRIRESAEKFRALVQNASDVVLVVGSDGTVR